MNSVLIEINVDVDSIEDARYIAEDLHKILDDCGVINSVNIVDEASTNEHNVINDDINLNDSFDTFEYVCDDCGSNKITKW